MCPGVESAGPAACPKCDMALEPAAPPLALTGTRYTCPMHPEVLREAPGDCPVCGMALEPVTIEIEEPPNPELADLTRRFWASLALALPLLIITLERLVECCHGDDRPDCPILADLAGRGHTRGRAIPGGWGIPGIVK